MPATDQHHALTPGIASDPAEAEILRGSIEAIVRAQFEAGQIRSANVYFGESYVDGKFVAKQPE